MSKEKTKIVITLKGGLVQSLISNNPDVQYVIVDQDVEAFDESIETAGETLPGTADVSNVLEPDAVYANLSEAFVDAKDTKEVYIKQKLEQIKF